MPVRIIREGKRTTAELSGDIDHHNAGTLRETLDAEVARYTPETLCLDFSSVSFMDSSGVGLVMGRYKNVSTYGGKVELSGMPGSIEKVMRLSGIEKIAKIVR